MMHHLQELEVKENFLMKDAGLINGLIRAQGDHIFESKVDRV